jgi:hypothetical protein
MKLGKRKQARKPAKGISTRQRSMTDAPNHRGSLKSPIGEATMKVRVRMYRQGLGDAFLLTFDVGGQEKHALIDCGSLGATTTKVTLDQVVADIRSTTNDHLDLLIATHEHWDHLAGFGRLEEEFGKIAVDRVWLAWTENPGDALAQKISKYKQDLGNALTSAAATLKGPGMSPQSAALGDAVTDVLGFFGDPTALGAGKFSETVNDAMEFVRKRLNAQLVYHNPGDGPLGEDWLPGFRFYVLGPPRDEDALYDTGDHGSAELYGIASGLQAAARFRSSRQPLTDYALSLQDAAERTDFDRQLPFDARFRYERGSSTVLSLFERNYFESSEKWRVIDEDWLNVASDLALQLDNATNNTSLALAIERVSDGKILLFPADAQEGNWVSWFGEKMEWTVKDSAGARTVRAKDLLARAVFYKAGHHASHNGTAKGHGLELMGSELTTFVSVDRAVALKRNPQGSWKMPARPLYRRLAEKCQGRVMRSDIGWIADAESAADKTTEKEFIGIATQAEWVQWTQAQQAAEKSGAIKISNQYVDYTLS